jgi:hypothetical protein
MSSDATLGSMVGPSSIMLPVWKSINPSRKAAGPVMAPAMMSLEPLQAAGSARVWAQAPRGGGQRVGQRAGRRGCMQQQAAAQLQVHCVGSRLQGQRHPPDEFGQGVDHNIGTPAGGCHDARPARMQCHGRATLTQGAGGHAQSACKTQAQASPQATTVMQVEASPPAPARQPLSPPPAAAPSPLRGAHVNVLSTTSCRALPCARSASRGRSATSSVGLLTDSVYSTCAGGAGRRALIQGLVQQHVQGPRPLCPAPQWAAGRVLACLGVGANGRIHGCQVRDVHESGGYAALGRQEALHERERAACARAATQQGGGSLVGRAHAAAWAPTTLARHLYRCA